MNSIHIRALRIAVKSIFRIALPVAVGITGGVCSAADSIGVACALPYTQHHPDPFFPCVGQHTVTYVTTNTDGAAKVTAELLALDANGNLIKSMPVSNGENISLASRISQTAWRFNTNTRPPQVYAPVPLLHVTVEDRGLKAEAFCSDVPYSQVVTPTGQVVSESSGNNTDVLVAVPSTTRRRSSFSSMASTSSVRSATSLRAHRTRPAAVTRI